MSLSRLNRLRHAGIAFILFLLTAGMIYRAEASSLSPEPVILRDTTVTAKPLVAAYYYEDTTARLSLEDILNKDDSAFSTSREDTLNFGFTDSAYWIVFDVKYESEKKEGGRKDWIVTISYPLLSDISVYLQRNGTIEEHHTGSLTPYSSGKLPFSDPAAIITTEAGKTCRVYLRVKSDGAMNIPLAVWEPMEYAGHVSRTQYLLGIYYGILIIMALFNCYLFIALRSRPYLLYVLFVVSLILFQLSLNGIGSLYLLPEHPWIFGRSVPIFGSVLAVFMNMFSREFLETKRNTPRLNKVLTLLIIAFLFLFIASFFLQYRITIQIVSLLSIAGTLILSLTTILCLAGGYRAARFYLISWIALLLGFVLFPLKNFGLIPYTTLTDYSIQIGSALQVVFMSLALADRFRIMQRENEETQRAALARQKAMADSFARFVPREFLRYLNRTDIVDVKLGDQVIKEMAVLFSDIRSFTNLSERMSPQENIDFINAYLDRIAPIIRNNNGFIDKYIGDAIMALFPESVDDAIAAAVAMQRELDRFNAARRESGENEISIGIGIHWGKMMLGTIGEAHRLETTVISDAVNTASRLEGLNKQLGSKILISGESLALAMPGTYRCRCLGQVPVKGKDRPVEVMEIYVDEKG